MMSNKTNEEKLRILQERLASIQRKKEIQQEEKIQKNKHVAPVFEEKLVNQPNIEPIAKTVKKPRNYSSLFKYFILLFVILLVGFSVFYAWQNKDNIISLFTSSKQTEVERDIIYEKSKFDDGNFIIVLNTFDKQELANAEAQNLIEKGYNCNILQLSGISNSEKEVFQTFIGPFNKEGEANQYLNSSELISEGNIFKLQ